MNENSDDEDEENAEALKELIDEEMLSSDDSDTDSYDEMDLEDEACEVMGFESNDVPDEII